MKKKESVHQKAIRLVEGGIVEIDGLYVRLCRDSYIFDPCFCCEMDSLCHFGDEMQIVCRECDIISRQDCFLVLADNKTK